MKIFNMTQKLYDIRNEPFDGPDSNHQSVFFLDARDDVFFVFEGPKRLTTGVSPEPVLFFPPPGGSLTPSPLKRFRFFGLREGSERSGSSDSNRPFSHSRRCRRNIAIVALASVTWMGNVNTRSSITYSEN